MLTIREFHGKDEEDNKIEEKIRNDIRQMLTESNTINDEADWQELSKKRRAIFWLYRRCILSLKRKNTYIWQ